MRRDIADTWDALSEEYNFWREGELAHSRVGGLLAQRPEPCRVAVDAGCGSGIHAAELAGSATRVVGFDISWGMLQLARKLKRERQAVNLALVVGDAEQPPLRPGCADFLISINTLNNTDLDLSLPALGALVAPQGRLAVQLFYSRFPRLANFAPLRVAYSLRAIPGVILRHGLVDGWRMARFLLRRDWIRGARKRRLTLAMLAAQVQRLLPTVRIAAPSPGFAAVTWSPPEPAR